MAVGTTDGVGEGKDPQPARSPRSTRKTRIDKTDGHEINRFFLAKVAGSNGVLELGKEVPNEPEAIVESLKASLSYFTVTEWRGVADFSGKKPLLKREAVVRAQNSG